MRNIQANVHKYSKFLKNYIIIHITGNPFPPRHTFLITAGIRHNKIACC